MPEALPTGTASLPPLGGRLLLAHRLAWWLSLALALTAVALSWIDPAASVAIFGLRLVKSLALIAVSAILYRRRPNDPVAAMLSLAFLLWTVSSSVDFIGNSMLAALVDRLRFLFFAFALLLFPDGQWRPGWTRPAGCAIAATFLLGLGEAAGLLPTQLFLPIAIGCVLAALVAMIVRYHSLDPGTQRLQLKWVLLGLVGGIGLILSARAGGAMMRGTAPMGSTFLIEALFQLGIVVVALGFLTSLLRFRLYDAEAAISRSAVYAALTLALVGTFAASEALIELLGQRYFGMAIGNVSGAIAAAIAAMMLTPLHHRISSWAEQHFQHDLTKLKSELPDLLAVLSASASVKRLAAAVLPRIEDAVHSTRMCLVIDGRLVTAQGIPIPSARRLLRGWVPPEDVAIFDRDSSETFPLRLALRCPLGSVRGWLFLGPRPDGSFYGRDDLEALASVVPAMQRGLFLAVEREGMHRARSRIDRAIRMSLDALKARVAELEAGLTL